MSAPDLTSASTHFAFGKNWSSYSEKITQTEIDEAVRGLSRLLNNESLAGKRILDIGSGSGLHSLAALHLGASEVIAIDVDRDSVETTTSILDRYASMPNWRTETRSVFDLSTNDLGMFDVVYSWGVLHHTGDMRRAIQIAAKMCSPGGLFVFALYQRVWLDWFWKIEKRWYASASPVAQRRARRLHIAGFRRALALNGQDPQVFIDTYRSNRGMDFYHDVHDWLGGWPYESILPHEVEELMRQLHFSRMREFTYAGRWFGRGLGLFSTGCDEYVYRASIQPTGTAD